MATREEYMNALRKADQAGDTAAAKAIARKIQSIGTSSEPEKGGGMLSFFNKKIASIAGAPVDAISGAIRSIGGGGVPDPRLVTQGLPQRGSPEQSEAARAGAESILPADNFGGTQSVRRGMANIGAPTLDRGPETTAEHIGDIGADALAFTAPLLKIGQSAQALGKVPSVGRGIAQDLSKFYTKKPVTAALSEAGGVAGAGLMRSVAEDTEMGPTASFLAETGGAVVGSVVAPLSNPFKAYSLAMKGLRKITTSQIMPWTKVGGKRRAAIRLQSLHDDVPASIKAINDHKAGYLTPAARSGDREALSLEKEILALDPSKQTAFAKRASEAENALAESLVGVGDQRDLASFVADQRRRMFDALDQIVGYSKKEADDAITRLGSEIDADQASRIKVEAMQLSQDAGKRQERIVWGAIPPKMEVPSGSYSAKASDILSKTSSSEYPDIPNTVHAFVKKLKADQIKAARALLKANKVPKKQWGKRIKEMEAAGELPEVTTINELDGQYKKLGDIMSKPNQNSKTIQVAKELREAILSDMDMIQGTEAEKALVGTARAFSKRMNDVFDVDPVASSLKKGSGGRRDIPEELAFNKSVGRGGQQGASDQRRIAKTGTFAETEGFGIADTTAVDAIDISLRNKFIDEAVIDGDFNISKAKAFLKKHSQTLEQYPQTRKQIDEFLKSADDLVLKSKESAARKKEALMASNKGTRIIEGAAVDEVGKAINSHSPVDQINVLLAATEGNQRAIQGLRAATGEWLKNAVTTGKKNDASGFPIIDGAKLKLILGDNKKRWALNRIYGKDGMNRLKRISHELDLIDRQSRSKGGIEISPDKPGFLLQLGGTLIGTRLGASMAGKRGSALKLASEGSNIMQRFMNHMIKGQMRQVLIDAVDDPKLYKALLEYNVKLPAAQKGQMEATLNAWMIQRGLHMLPEDELLTNTAEQ